MITDNKILLDYMWVLFNHLDDTDGADIQEAVLACVEVFGFDMAVLPTNLYKSINERLEREAAESYWENVI